MRRIGLGAVVVLVAVVLTACPSSVPPDYSPPKIDSVEVSPSPVQPGDTVTITVRAHDDGAIAGGVMQRLLTPTGATLPPEPHCEIVTAPQGSFKDVIITATCVVPTFASNGTWRLKVHLNDGSPPTQNYPGTTTHLAFQVTGGSEDRSAPRLVSYSTEPAVVDRAAPFTVTARLRDDSPIFVGQPLQGDTFFFVKPFAPHSMFICSDPSVTPVSATEADVTVSCLPSLYYNGGPAEVGIHLANMPVYDALHNAGTVPMQVDARPSP